MTMQGVVDAWVTELAAVSGLTTALTHKYASWSLEQLTAGTNERHLAVWPNAEVETREGLVTAPADLLTTSYTIVIWEEAASEATRLYDDDAANQAWLALYEAVQLRLYASANRALGDTTIMATRFKTGRFGMRGAVRFMELEFTVQRPISFT